MGIRKKGHKLVSTKRYFNEILSQKSTQPVEYYKAIDWNQVEDMIDKLTWEKLTEQFWLDTRIPVSNDLDDWRIISRRKRCSRESIRWINIIRYTSIRRRCKLNERLCAHSTRRSSME